MNKVGEDITLKRMEVNVIRAIAGIQDTKRNGLPIDTLGNDKLPTGFPIKDFENDSVDDPSRHPEGALLQRSEGSHTSESILES